MAPLYLSRLLLDARRPEVADLLGDSHLMHVWLLRAFPQVASHLKPRDVHQVLFRVEELDHPRYGVRLLVQSETKPDWDVINAHALLPPVDDRGNPAVRDVAPVYAKLVEERPYRFRILAAPTRSIAERGDDNRRVGRGVRVPITSELDVLRWLQRKGERHGFRLVGDRGDVLDGRARVTARYAIRGHQADRDNAITHRVSLIEGLLLITDRGRFQQMLVEGIGTGRAYGTGLMSLSAVPQAEQRQDSTFAVAR